MYYWLLHYAVSLCFDRGKMYFVLTENIEESTHRSFTETLISILMSFLVNKKYRFEFNPEQLMSNSLWEKMLFISIKSVIPKCLEAAGAGLVNSRKKWVSWKHFPIQKLKYDFLEENEGVTPGPISVAELATEEPKEDMGSPESHLKVWMYIGLIGVTLVLVGLGIRRMYYCCVKAYNFGLAER